MAGHRWLFIEKIYLMLLDWKRLLAFAAISEAIDALHNPPSVYGFVAATKVDENFMSQVLEHVF